MFADAFLMKKPKRVPVAIATGFYPFLYAGYTCKDAMYDYEKLGKAMKKFHADFMPDTAASAGLYVPGRLLEILDYKLYHWPGHGVPENTSYQCAEAEYMKPDEYAAYLSDPSDYFIRTLPASGYGSSGTLERASALHRPSRTAVYSLGHDPLRSAAHPGNV